MKIARVAFAVLLMISVFGCRTRSLTKLQPIDVQHGLTQEQVETAILMAISGRYRPPDVDPHHRLTREEVDGIVGVRAKEGRGIDRRQRDTGGWRLEHRGEGFVEAAYYTGKHSMVVDLEYDAHRVLPRIVGSQNLSQSETRIHKAAIEWARELLAEIEQAMGRVASLR